MYISGMLPAHGFPMVTLNPMWGFKNAKIWYLQADIEFPIVLTFCPRTNP